MDRILVVNLTRLGDLIQTGPLITGLRARHPGAHLGLLALESFAAAARLLPGVDEVLTLDQDQAVGRLLDSRSPLSARAAWFRGQARRLRGPGWDLVINLSHSRDSAVLAGLLARGEVRGIRLRPDGRVGVEHDWARYFFCVTGNRAVNHLNLVDIYRLVGDLGPTEGQVLALEAGAAAVARVEELLCELPGPDGVKRPLVIVQPGASRENRRWPLERLASFMRRLHAEAGAAFLLSGSAAEEALCASLAEQCRALPHLNLAGRTSLEELAALCSRADLLVTNDTGTLHVAAARGLPSVSLFFATALPWETGPWRPGCFVLQADLECSPCDHQVVCPHVMCRERIPEDSVAGASLELLRRAGWPVAPPDGWESRGDARVWETLRDARGLQDLRLLGRRRPGATEIAARIYRRLWLDDLCPAAAGPSEPKVRAFAQELASWLRDWSVPLPETATLLAEWRLDLLELARLAGEGPPLVGRVRHEMAQEQPRAAVLEEVVAAIPALDDRLFTWELCHPLLRPLGVFFRFGKEELRDDDNLECLGAETVLLYERLVARALMAAELAGQACALFHHEKQTRVEAA